MESARLGGNWTLLFGQKKIFRDEISPTKRYSEKVDGRQDICRWSATRLKSTVLKNWGHSGPRPRKTRRKKYVIPFHVVDNK
jgi:hypothetical protein